MCMKERVIGKEGERKGGMRRREGGREGAAADIKKIKENHNGEWEDKELLIQGDRKTQLI